MSVRRTGRSGEIRETLRTIRDEYWRGIEEVCEDQSGQAENVLVFRLGGERYAIVSRLAREVLRIPRIVRIPRLSPSIRGIINLRGQIVAVSDLRPYLGLPCSEITEEGRLVVAQAGGVTTALAVEKVEGLRSIPIAQIEPLTEGLTGLPREAVEGQVTTEEEILVLLRLDHILRQPEFIVDTDNG